MDPVIVTSGLVMLGTVAGAAVGVIGTILTTRVTARIELGRVAVEAAMREWEKMHSVAQERGGQIFPLALFIHYNVELLRLVDAGKLTAESYQELMRRRDQVKQAIEATQSPRR